MRYSPESSTNQGVWTLETAGKLNGVTEISFRTNVLLLW